MIRAAVFGRGSGARRVEQELPEEALFDVPEDRWQKRPEPWHHGRRNAELALACDEAATKLREGHDLTTWRITATSERPKLTIEVMANGLPMSEEPWAKLVWVTTGMTAYRRMRATAVATGEPEGAMPTCFTKGVIWEFEEHPDTADERARFQQDLDDAKAGDLRALKRLREFLGGKENCAVALVIKAEKDHFTKQTTRQGGLARVEVDRHLMLARLADPGLQFPQHVFWLLRAAQILAHHERPKIAASQVIDAPQFSDLVPGAPDLASFIARGDEDEPGWPRESEEDKYARIMFLRDAKFMWWPEYGANTPPRELRKEWTTS